MIASTRKWFIEYKKYKSRMKYKKKKKKTNTHSEDYLSDIKKLRCFFNFSLLKFFTNFDNFSLLDFDNKLLI